MSKVAGFSTDFEAFDSSFNQKAAGHLNLELGTKSVGTMKFDSDPDWINLTGVQRGDTYFLAGGDVSLELNTQLYMPGGFTGSMWYKGKPLFLNAFSAKG